MDQSVADMDALGTSLRQVETGLRPDGEQTSLFRLVEPQPDSPSSTPTHPAHPLLPPDSQGPKVYYRVAPGVVTRTDRLEYLVRVGEKQFGLNIQPRRDGEFIELPSANTVFQLDPWPADGTQLTRSPSSPTVDFSDPAANDPRLDYRVDTRIDTRIDGAPSIPAPAPEN